MKIKITNSKDYFVCSDGYVSRNGKRIEVKDKRYRRVRIWYEDGSRKDCYVHRLVAEHFVPNPHGKPEVNHKDGNRLNNHYQNLEWVTPAENQQHAVETGLRKSGHECSYSTLSEQDVHQICQMLQDGCRAKDIQKVVDVSQPVVSAIRNKRQHKAIAKQYTFPPKVKTLSQDTVRWVWHCKKAGVRNRDIISKYHGHLTDSMILGIMNGSCYKYITKDL